MTQEEKMQELADLFEVEVGNLTPETELSALTWDSMTMLSVIALVKSRFDKRVSGTDLRAMKYVSDILSVMQ